MLINNLILFSFFGIVFFGSLGVGLFEVNVLSFLFFTVVLAVLSLKIKLNIPPLFKSYLMFLLILLIGLSWSLDKISSFEFFIPFAVGALIWFIFYNLEIENSHFVGLVIFLGVIFALFFLISLFNDNLKANPASLFSPIWVESRHVHLGDYWMVVFLFVLNLYLSENTFSKKLINLSLLLFAIFIIFISSSRSAMVGALVGAMGVLGSRYGKRFDILKILFVFIFVLLFLTATTGKSVFTSRDYFIQGLVGLFHHPFGVGGGNFRLVSYDPKNQILWFNNTSSLAHNIFIEMISAVGIFGFYFIYIVLNLVKEGIRIKTIYWLAFISLFINFFFDYTYEIPAMLYLWFSFLGLAQRNNLEKE